MREKDATKRRYFINKKTDMEKSQQIRNSLTYLIPSVLDNALPFLTLPIFTRILSPEDYGVLALALVYAVIATGLANLGLLNVYDRNFFQYRQDSLQSAKLFYSIIAFVGLNVLVIVAITSIFRLSLSKWIIHSPAFGHVLLIAFCSEATAALRQYYLFFFKNREDAVVYVRCYVLNGLLTFSLSIFFVAILKVGVVGILYGRFLGNSITLIILQGIIKKFLPLAFDFRYLTQSLKLSLPLTPRVFLGVISNQFDKFMIGLLSTVGGVGIYSIGQKVAYVLFVYMTSLQNVFQPQVYKRMFDENQVKKETIGGYLFPFLYISLFIGLLIVLFSEEAIRFLTPSAYHGAILISIILALYYGILFFAKINSVQLLFAKKTGLISFLAAFTLVLSVVIMVPFIQWWGAVGAAWGMLIVGIISGIVTFRIAQGYFRIDFPHRRVITVLAVFFLAAFTIIILFANKTPYVYRLLTKGVYLIIFFALGHYWRIVSRENIKLIKNILWLRNYQGEGEEV